MTARPAPLCRAAARPRAGFTLLEMLAVILIIAILVALAFPAYQAVMVNARSATVRAEMAAMGSAIADFKSKYGLEPPSRVAFQTAAGGAPADPSALAPSTKAVLRKMFPQIDLSSSSPIMGNLVVAGVWGEQLKGNEALVFFLGGVRRYDGSALTDDLIGFSKNPTNPFAQPGTGATNRVGPFFEFKSGPDRLAENAQMNLVYSDPLSKKPYLFASTAETGSYRDSATPALSDFASDAPGFRAYRKPDSDNSATSLANNPFWNPNSYQLISAGPDQQYGDGGVFDPSGKVPLVPTGQPNVEADNLANFNDGPLGG
jgi:general secretion pathway protein G